MKDGLYHKEIGLPACAEVPWCSSEIELIYSEHAKQAADDDRYGSVPRLDIAEFARHEVIEVQVENGQPVKAVLRIPCDNRPGLDMVLVILRPEAGKALVKTVWFNEVSDKHHTLNRSLYRIPA